MILGAPTAAVADAAALVAEARDLLMPEVLLVVFGCLALVLGVALPRERRRVAAYAALVGTGLAAASALAMWLSNADVLPRYGFFGMVVVDELAIVLEGIFLLGVSLSIALSVRYLDDESAQRGEYYALMLFATVGMMLAASSADLLVLYVSLELSALSVCALLGCLARSRASREAALRYFLLGAFSSAVMLYGMSLVYGLAGSTSLGRIREAFTALAVPGAAGDPRYLALAAAVLLAAGVCFKIAAVPFHLSAPDACEDAPAPVAAFASVGVKAAGFAIFARLFLEALPTLRSPGGLPGWGLVFGIVAAVTMTWGNLGAFTQRSSKRLLAYTSVAHAGYLLLGPLAGDRAGYAGLLISLAAYVAASLGACGVLVAIRRKGIAAESIDDFDGLAKRSPGLAALMAIFLLGLAGLPPTAGFVGRILLVDGLISSGDPWLAALALVAVLNTAVSAYYYFEFVKAMFVGEPAAGAPECATSGGVWAALGVAAALTVLVGVYPRPAIALSERAVERIAPARHRQGE